MYTVEKLFDGFSCCFRQHLSKSHCSKLHGYALEFLIEFRANRLNEQNWVVDFGGFDKLKGLLKQLFDHTTLVATRDPHREMFKHLHAESIINLKFFEEVGCEAFAKIVFDCAKQMHPETYKVTCIENKKNSASYQMKKEEPYKPIFIFGAHGSGKRLKAREIVGGEKTLFKLDLKLNKEDYFFKWIVFEDVNFKDLEKIKKIASQKGALVKMPYQKEASFVDMPKIIFTSTDKRLLRNSRRFKIINLF